MRSVYTISTSIAIILLANNAEGSTICKHYAQRLPSLAQTQCESAKLQDAAARSVKGRTIWTSDVKPADADTRVLVIGGMHGDELSSAAMAFRWIGLAQAALGAGEGTSNPAALGSTVHWRFIPALNPDGLFAQPAKRVNARGVDLNRNFPTPNWTRDSRIYWEKRTGKDPRRWPGTQPLSEPEARFLHAQMGSFKPNLIVSIHAPYGVLDFDGPTVPPSKLGRLYLDQVGIFPGSLGNYGGVHKGIPVVTIELPNAARTPPEAEMRQMWSDLQRWMSERLALPRTAGKSLAAAGGSPPLTP
ncbi:MAG: murein peptide amidase A [Rhodoferax sp.]|nr:murein peptide amidase A [Rhodoferax sp.]